MCWTAARAAPPSNAAATCMINESRALRAASGWHKLARAIAANRGGFLGTPIAPEGRREQRAFETIMGPGGRFAAARAAGAGVHRARAAANRIGAVGVVRPGLRFEARGRERASGGAGARARM